MKDWQIHWEDAGAVLTGTRILHPFRHRFSQGMTYVVGNNGAGKSTLLKLLTGVVSPFEGDVHFTRRSSKGGREEIPAREVRRFLGYVPQVFTGYPQMRVEQYLRFVAIHHGLARCIISEVLESWFRHPTLAALRKKRMKGLSGGEQRKVGLVQALLHHPHILILDEPFVGLDIEERLFFQAHIQRIAHRGMVIMSTHQLEDISMEGTLCILEEGNLIHQGFTKVKGTWLEDFFAASVK
ncbi:ATP-binding cassette domain-containing protein [Marininema halotolerans]|uniref:ABC-2 type transport system ATP-binding protein n=1 Tax=Marininema halotolerans TaxID=1155944 RepID=A0A1I6NU09_9BACL|nr:ATP-binding cassette domain-containing protein [Marininema halotolerans]SFS31365.1 ABC-2 type transport system ATP-binding protein [Marininema halotolerans]